MTDPDSPEHKSGAPAGNAETGRGGGLDPGAEVLGGLEVARLPGDASEHLVGLALGVHLVAAEAGDQGKAIEDHWAHMIVHGTLHLLGFDHENDAEAAAMEALETQILASQSVTDPYAG